ncbi:uncharacterized protein TOT_020000238 [Theileria orientalis strain Shintoku]|uniref:Peptidase M16C associated domain-containing protein n=1 Tax=Theileria orientalis strain Shintoku TaxID=869250 RepID=J4C379_THEOR|nr:uncharacterized protein TOT_020000238 [Theileria orientalis strain Shintoku]PVC53039.1 hypothetical protein MACL_00000350 [Theileria orientalis]BAM39971.1 uncharacterized protein TOT_020000238 [Theileria orientalis strain Shintoku]|eukprot:XP_009690272.1 uncharacterized protein TOT_020000238 [Theileria orientalis strain Shintoku]
MILRRKILTLSKVNNVLTKQQDQLNYHLNKNTFRQFSAYSLERSKVVGMATYSDVNVSHNSKLSSKNQLHDQRYSVVGKIPYSSGLEQVDSAEKQRYDASAYLKSSQSDQKVDPKKVEKWVKEAMEVEHEGYDKVLTSYVQNVDAVVTFYKHKATGLTVVSFRTSDKNKEMAFDVSAPTYQFNDHGCTHVTEHSVLIKTEDYKVFNSFYYQVAGMYYSFLNALYYKNRTRYYFTSLNEKSFYQLADQFMSAFFKPSFLKDEDIVKQEGWHYKVTKSNEKDSNTKEVGVDVHGRHVTFSGVVYNEMKKRTYANPVDKGVSVLDHNLFTNTLRYDSGGNPEDIVDLTHQELVDFYNMFYGPSTATVYFHGANDVYKRLDFVDKYLKKHNLGVSPDPKTGKYSHTASPEFVKQISVHEEYKEAPKYVKTQYSAQNKDEDVMMMGWVLDPKYKGTNKYDLDSVDKLAFEVVKHMLLDSHNSVFQKALVESELGSRVVGPGLDDFYPLYPHVTFMFGVEGVKYTEKTREENVKKFEQQVFKALKDVVEKGFDREAVKSALSKVEFKHTEQNYVMKEHRQGYYPKGLTQLRFVQPQLEQGKDPLEFVRLDKLMAELKNRVSKDRNYLSNLVKKHMLNNTTRVTLHMEAVESKEYEKEFNKKVVEKLKSRLSHLSKEEVDKLEEEYKKFKEEREKRQDEKAYESFPEFDPKEVLKKDSKDQKKVYKLSESSLKEQSSLKRSHPDSKESEVTVLSNKVDSNGILYMDYTLALDSLSLDDLKYMYLFSQMLQEAGTDKLTPEEVSYLVDKNLGGVSFSTYFTTESNNQTYDDPTKGLGYLVVRSKSLKHKTDQMVDVVHDLLVNANFSNSKKGVMLVKRSVKQLEYSLRDLAHVFTFRRLSKRFSVANYADEVANGYSQLVFLRDELVPLAEKDWSKVESKLNEIRQKLMNMKNLTVNLTGDQELLDSFLKNATQYHSKLTSTFKSGQQKTQTKVWVEEVLKNKLLESTNKDELIVLPLRNNFVGVGGKLFSKNDKKSGEHSVAMHYLMRTYLYRFLRTSGGAYGAHVYLTNTGHVAMVSYADPNFMSTLEVYKKVPEGLKEASDWLSEKGMKMHVVGTLSSLDRQHNPEDKAKYVMKSYLRGETDEQIQKLREQVVSASKKVFKEVEAKFRESKDWMTVSSLVNRESAESAPSHYKKLF